MSEVRRGEDVVLRRPVAIKLLRDLGDSRSVARFEQEARILARLQHPDVVTVFDSGVDNDERFIVMELVEGPTLRELLDAEGRLALNRAGGIARSPGVGTRLRTRARSYPPGCQAIERPASIRRRQARRYGDRKAPVS